jgi:hypothetical protein
LHRVTPTIHGRPQRVHFAQGSVNRPLFTAGAIIDAYSQVIDALRKARVNARTQTQINSIDSQLSRIYGRAIDAGTIAEAQQPALAAP